MLAEVPVSLSLLRVPSNFLPTDIAHRISTDAGQFVAARGFDEAGPAAGAGAFDGCSAGRFDGGTEGEEKGLVAGVWVVPGFGAFEAAGLRAGGFLAAEAR